MCLSVIVKPGWKGGPDPLGAVVPWGKKSTFQLIGLLNQSTIIGKQARKTVVRQGRRADCDGSTARWRYIHPVRDRFSSFYVIMHRIIPWRSVLSVQTPPTCRLAHHNPNLFSPSPILISLCSPHSVFIVMVSGYMQKHGENFGQSANYRSWHYCPQELSRTRTCRINKDLVVGFA